MWTIHFSSNCNRHATNAALFSEIKTITHNGKLQSMDSKNVIFLVLCCKCVSVCMCLYMCMCPLLYAMGYVVWIKCFWSENWLDINKNTRVVSHEINAPDLIIIDINNNIHTATATLPRILSGIGSLRHFISFSRHVAISSMHIHTSSCHTSSYTINIIITVIITVIIIIIIIIIITVITIIHSTWLKSGFQEVFSRHHHLILTAPWLLA